MAYQEFDREKVKFLPLKERKNKMTLKDIYQLNDEIPKYENPDLGILAQRIIEARQNNKPVIWMMGAHPIRRGNSRFIIDLMKRGIITHIAANAACAIHDFELAFQGETLEDVEYYIKDGKFGNWEETGFYINTAAIDAFKSGCGLGEAIARMIYYGVFWSLQYDLYKPFYAPYKDISVFRAAYELKIPITVHKSIGQDITDQHPLADFAALGWASGKDFLIFANSIAKLEGGGVYLNIGTQVTGPEVYLKALSMARNVAAREGREIKHFTTALFDVVDLGDWKNKDCDWHKQENYSDQSYYFRPKKTVLIRTVKDGGESFYIRGDFRATIPALYHNILKLFERRSDGKKDKKSK